MDAPLSNSPLGQLAGFNGLDWFLVLVVLWSVITALLRGIIRELFGLAGTVLGLLLASWNYTALASWLSRWITSLPAAEVAAFGIIAFGIMLGCTLLGRLLRGTARTVGLGPLDRLAGAAFGLLRGALLGVLFLMIATAFLPPQNLLATSYLAPYFLAAAREVSFVVPQDLQRRIGDGIKSIRHLAQR